MLPAAARPASIATRRKFAEAAKTHGGKTGRPGTASKKVLAKKKVLTKKKVLAKFRRGIRAADRGLVQE